MKDKLLKSISYDLHCGNISAKEAIDEIKYLIQEKVNKKLILQNKK